MKYIALFFIVLALVSADKWAVIVSGSDGYYNYRHQSDACHAYQIHLRNGIPASNIIQFNYDDVANHKYNPFPGELYNQPGDESPNNYEGCVIDYKGDNNNPEVYLAVLKGDADLVKNLTGIENPKVLKSTSDDNVFLSFFDHGAPGIICFPNDEVLTARQLNDVMVYMFKNRMYKKMVYYLEACESGSMFDKILPNNLNIYTTTAANPTESSWGYYCGDDAIVKGKDVGTCLGDLYSVVWMEDADRGIKTETLADSWDIILKKVDLSHPQQYGDKTYLNDLFFSFIGNSKSPNAKSETKPSIAWNSRDIGYKTYEHISQYGETEEIKKLATIDLEKINKHINKVDKRFMNLMKELVKPEDRYVLLTSKNNILNNDNSDCYYDSIYGYKKYCTIKDYDLKYFSSILNLCNYGKTSSEIISSLQNVC